MGLLDLKPIVEEKRKGYSKSALFASKRRLKLLRRAERKLRKKHAAGTMPKYQAYINSRQWRLRCAAFYEKYGHSCAACGSKSQLHVHHMSYAHMGSERDDELAALCKDCHAEYHALNGTQRNMIKLTTAFIEDKRQAAAMPAL